MCGRAGGTLGGAQGSASGFPSAPSLYGRRHTRSTLDQQRPNGCSGMWHNCGSVWAVQTSWPSTQLSPNTLFIYFRSWIKGAFVELTYITAWCCGELDDQASWYRYDEGARRGRQWTLDQFHWARSLPKYHADPWLSCIELNHWSTLFYIEYLGGQIKTTLFPYHKLGLPGTTRVIFLLVCLYGAFVVLISDYYTLTLQWLCRYEYQYFLIQRLNCSQLCALDIATVIVRTQYKYLCVFECGS